MSFKKESDLICMNPECRAEFVIVKRPPHDKTNPRCFCGTEMKKVYQSPVLRVLNDSEREQVKRMLSIDQLKIKSAKSR